MIKGSREMEKKERVIVRLAGGLGNQFFQYAAARRLALRRQVPLQLDAASGFNGDYYQQSYSLKYFRIQENFAPFKECFLGSAGKVRRRIQIYSNKRRFFKNRSYLKEESPRFNPKLLNFQVTKKVYLEGYWQSEGYFKDIEDNLRQEFKLRRPEDSSSRKKAKAIQDSQSVCLHVRRLHGVPNVKGALPLDSSSPNANFLGKDYYQKAVDSLLRQVGNPHFFVFSDCPHWVKENLRFDYPVTFIERNKNGRDYEDFWLMSLCKYFIIANSTFSWWGAWLGDFENKIVIAPLKGFANTVDMMPESWIAV